MQANDTSRIQQKGRRVTIRKESESREIESGKGEEDLSEVSVTKKTIKESDLKRFWAKVSKGETNGCWNWQRAKSTHGYGLFFIWRRAWRAHRLSWMMQNGEIPEGLVILHKCDNPSCVRPSHLALGTQLDNIADRESKGRGTMEAAQKASSLLPSKKGEENNASKLTDDLVIKILGIYSAGGVGQKALSTAFNVSHSLIHQLVHRKIWKHI